MKKNLTAVFFFSFILVNFAQSPVSKGVYFLGGSIYYSSQSSDNSDSSTDTFIFSPRVGYFFIDNFYVGLSVNYDKHSFGDNSSSNYGFGPEVRYYFDANEKIKPFLGLAYNYRSADGDVSYNTFTVNGGADLFIARNFAIEGSIDYSIINRKSSIPYFSTDDTVKRFQVKIGLNYFIF